MLPLLFRYVDTVQDLGVFDKGAGQRKDRVCDDELMAGRMHI